MSNEARWITLVAAVGFLTSYILWGHQRPLVVTTPTAVPTATTTITAIPAPATSVATTPQNPPAHGVTALKFEPDSIDLGLVPVNESRSADMVLRNPTDKLITIKDLAASCGCLQLHSDSNDVPPKGTLAIHCTFAAVPGRKTDLVRGSFRTSEANTTFVTFDVHAKVKEEFILESSTLGFETLKKNVSKTKDVEIRSDDGLPFKITLVTGERKEFKYTWEPVAGKNGSAYTIHVTMQGEKGGMVTDNAAIITDRTPHGTVPLNVSGMIEPDVAATPTILISEMDASRVVAAFSTVIRRATSGPLEILSVSDGAQHPVPLDYVVDRLEEGACRVSIKFKVPYPMRAPFGYVQIKTNVEEQNLNVPYRVNLAAPNLTPAGKATP